MGQGRFIIQSSIKTGWIESVITSKVLNHELPFSYHGLLFSLFLPIRLELLKDPVYGCRV